MPEIKNYDGKKKTAGSEKRRPHREAQAAAEQTADVMEASSEINTEAQNEGVSAEEIAAKDSITEGESIHAAGEAQDETHQDAYQETHEKIHLDFYGSDIIREKAPKVMELADTVVDEWIQDGEFEGLPVGHPLAQLAAAKVLRKAKDVEKKLEEKGVFAIAKMGAEYVKAEINKRRKL